MTLLVVVVVLWLSSTNLTGHLLLDSLNNSGVCRRGCRGGTRGAYLWHLLSLNLLQFGPLILEPNLNYPNTEARFPCQLLAHFSARLLTLVKGILEGSPLARGQYGARPLRSPAAVDASRARGVGGGC